MTDSLALCPRCRSTKAAEVAQSPVPGRWVVHSCRTCWYVWRCTEGPEATHPDYYPEDFRLNVADFEDVPSEV